MTSCKVGVCDGSEVVRVACHCIYRPEGNPEATGEVPPTEAQEGAAASLRNRVSEALTSKVMSVLLCSVSAQDKVYHIAPETPVS